MLDENLCVANCLEFQYGTHPMEAITADEYLQYWKSISTSKRRLMYLKDWHYFRFDLVVCITVCKVGRIFRIITLGRNSFLRTGWTNFPIFGPILVMILGSFTSAQQAHGLLSTPTFIAHTAGPLISPVENVGGSFRLVCSFLYIKETWKSTFWKW